MINCNHYKQISYSTTRFDLFNSDQTSPSDIFLIQKDSFNYENFCLLENDLSEIRFYLSNHNPILLKEEEAFKILSKIFATNDDEENILSTVLMLISCYTFDETIDFEQIYESYLNDLEISELLICILIKLVNISKKSIINEDILQYIINETLFIYNDQFWTLCICFRKFENADESNTLWEIGLLNVIERVINEYDSEQIKLSTIELIFKVLLSIITAKNISFIENSMLILDAADYFKNNFIEAYLVFLLLIDEEKAVSYEEDALNDEENSFEEF